MFLHQFVECELDTESNDDDDEATNLNVDNDEAAILNIDNNEATNLNSDNDETTNLNIDNDEAANVNIDINETAYLNIDNDEAANQNIENDEAANLSIDNLETTKSSKAFEKWAFNYKNTFLSPQEFVSTKENKEHTHLNEETTIHSSIENLVNEDTTSSNTVKDSRSKRKRKTVSANKSSDSKNLVENEIQNKVEPLLKKTKTLEANFSADFETQSQKNTCAECKTTLSCRSALTRHIKLVHRKQWRFNCHQCDFKCYHIYEMDYHKSYVHDKVRNYKCDLCPYESFYKASFIKHFNSKQHIKALNPIKSKDSMNSKDSMPLKCKQCNFRCSERLILNNHIDFIHRKLKLFNCKYCSYQSKCKADLKCHIYSVHKNLEPTKCEQCNFRCSQKSLMKNHVELVHKQKKLHYQGVYNSGSSGKTQGKKKTQGTQGKLREFETYSGNFYEQSK